MHAAARTLCYSLAGGLASLALASPALAQDSLPVPAPTPTPTPTVTPTPPPAPPAKGRVHVSVKAPYRWRGHALMLAGHRFRVVGTVTPYVSRQKLTVKVKDGRHTAFRRRLRIHRGPHGTGVFGVRVRLHRAATYRVRAVHKGTRKLAFARSAHDGHVIVASPSATFGSRGPLVRLLQGALHRMRYEAHVSGVYGAATGRAVLAWHKHMGRARLYSADERTIRDVLAGRGRWHVRHPHAGHHVEADISQQVLALIKGRRVVRIYPTSSGKPSTPTVLGHFRVYLKTPGTNGEGMVDSNYFIRGYAIHGYYSVPTYNASHGCLRVPIPDARPIYDWLRIGDSVFVEP
jgi:peptidoglycan hydrolase-like protein with peptidoglycan-binding domain